MNYSKITIVHFFDPSWMNGGGLYLETLLRTLARVPEVHSTIISIGNEDSKASNQQLALSLRFEHHHVTAPVWTIGTRHDKIKSELMDKWHFIWERDLRIAGERADCATRNLVLQQKPNLIVMVNLLSTLLAPSLLDIGIPICLVATNNMRQEQRSGRRTAPIDYAATDMLAHFVRRNGNLVADMRLRRYEKKIYARCNSIVFLSHKDIPAELPGHVVRAVLPPIPTRSVHRWTNQRSNRLLFVGNISHHPNQVAIEWICRRFATALSALDVHARINIIGASADQVPRYWHAPNVDFLGKAHKSEVQHQMTTVALFIAPIAYQGGAKLKLAECISHGTPFLASAAAMSGLSFLSPGPCIALNQPSSAARLALDYLHTPNALEQLSDSVSKQADEAYARQPGAWNALFSQSMIVT